MKLNSGKIDSHVVGRLAPSPTGALHLGNARSFLLAWLSARSKHGQLFLRIEDTDSPRVKPWAVQQTVEDLRWLGLEWDHWPVQPRPVLGNASNEAPLSLFRQTDRLARYTQVFEELRQRDCVYVCECSRKDVDDAASAPHDASLPLLEGTCYPGTCREKSLEPEAISGQYCWRWKFDPAKCTWMDQVVGEQSALPAKQLGDFVIAKSTISTDGSRQFVPAYQLAVVIDDFDQEITEVVRGDDLIASTYRQLAILQRLQWTVPKYFHVPLIIGPDGRRLAKRHGDTRVAEFRERGIRAEALMGYLAYSLGFAKTLRCTTAAELLESFNWNEMPSEPTVFNLEEQMPVLEGLSRQ